MAETESTGTSSFKENNGLKPDGLYTISFTLAIAALLGAALVSSGIAERRYSVRYIAPAPSIG